MGFRRLPASGTVLALLSAMCFITSVDRANFSTAMGAAPARAQGLA